MDRGRCASDGSAVGQLEAVNRVFLQRPILVRASEPFPAPLRELDALHPATALVRRDRMRRKLV